MSIESIELWHKRARQNPSEADFNVQLGCHLEEVCEMLSFMAGATEKCADAIQKAEEAIGDLADDLKSGRMQAEITDRTEFLDSIADQIVTAVGVGHCAGMNVSGACDEVNSSNWSKFDENGHPFKDANGKISKGPNYSKPNLTPFI